MVAIEQQTTDTVLMVRPYSFQFNEQTAHTNVFQRGVVDARVAEKAREEFQAMVATLRAQEVRVIVLSSREDVVTPDAVFPNNWFTTHQGGVVVLYPMLAENRRFERQLAALKQALAAHGIGADKFIDLSHYEKENKFLEGTGSVILDRPNRLAYAALSPRTHPDVLREFAEKLQYTPVIFHSYDRSGVLVYHTNVMMSIGAQFVVIAADSIVDPAERESVLATFKKTHKQVITFSLAQMEKMAGNILEVRSVAGKAKIVMSKTAHEAFTAEQLNVLEKLGEVVVVNVDTIEKVGGGSARCMLAEVF